MNELYINDIIKVVQKKAPHNTTNKKGLIIAYEYDNNKMWYLVSFNNESELWYLKEHLKLIKKGDIRR